MDDLSESLQASLAWNDLTDDQKAELDRRIAEADANPLSLIPLAEVQRRLSKYK